jgi:hypothetical protein
MKEIIRNFRLPGAVWKGFDSTPGQVVGNNYIAVDVSRHPESEPRVSGTFQAANPQSYFLSEVLASNF